MNENAKGDGSISDLATGKKINLKKPEEKVRQEYENILNCDYGYDYNLMDIEVPIIRGSKGKPRTSDNFADIVVYSSKDKRDQFSDIVGIVETKRPERKDGIKQLMSYMSATNCIWGVWTNSIEIEYLYKDPTNGKIKRDFIYQIPRYGERFEDIGKIRKDTLIPANSLKRMFTRMLNTLYTNTNISRREKLGNELIRIIFCKIWDEKYYPNEIPKFRVGIGENADDVKARIITLFDEVKKELVNDGVFDIHETITLESKSIPYVVGELERYSLLKTSKDVVGDAFEVFAESKLVGEKGEFFTPREVVKTAIQIVKPQPEQTIFDPACGSGGFLIYALEYVWNEMETNRKYKGSKDIGKLKKEMAERCFFGIDKEMDLVKISKAYMAIVGDGRGKITHQNTLHKPNEFEGKAKEIFVQKDNKFKKFDIIFTNPPFGSKIKVLKEEAGQFELGTKKTENKKTGSIKKTAKDTEPQELFIERCLEMLNDSGTLAIVLPETYFHAPSKKEVLDFMRKNNNIKAVVDLPHDTFRPHNNAKTILIILEKNVKQQDEILMAVAEGIGHDALGRTLYKYDYENQKPSNEIWDDTKVIREEIKNPKDDKNKNTFMIKTSDIKNDIFIPRYYWKTKIKEIQKQAKEKNLNLISVSDLIKKGILYSSKGHGSPQSEYKGKGDIPYVRVSDIVNWDIYKNYTAMVPEAEYERVKGNGIDLQENDVLFVRRGSYRIGTVALVTKSNLKVLLMGELTVFRVTNNNNDYFLSPSYLMYLFSHELVQQQLANLIFMDTTLPNISNRWNELKLPFFKTQKESDKVKKDMDEIFTKKQDVLESIDRLNTKYGNLTT